MAAHRRLPTLAPTISRSTASTTRGVLRAGAQGAVPRGRGDDLPAQEGARVDAAFRHKALDTFLAKPIADLGRHRDARRDRLRCDHLLPPRHREAGDELGRRARERQADLRRLGIPEAERKFLAGVSAQYEFRGGLPLRQGGAHQAGRDLPRHGLRAARARGHRQRSTSPPWIPAADNKFSALNSRCGRAARSSTCRSTPRWRSAAGLLPDQRRSAWASSNGR